MGVCRDEIGRARWDRGVGCGDAGERSRVEGERCRRERVETELERMGDGSPSPPEVMQPESRPEAMRTTRDVRMIFPPV